jgi:hypothetical protein
MHGTSSILHREADGQPRASFGSGQLEVRRAMNPRSLWETVGMATQRKKADKAQRQSDQLEKKSERRPEQERSKRKVR